MIDYLRKMKAKAFHTLWPCECIQLLQNNMPSNVMDVPRSLEYDNYRNNKTYHVSFIFYTTIAVADKPCYTKKSHWRIFDGWILFIFNNIRETPAIPDVSPTSPLIVQKFSLHNDKI